MKNKLHTYAAATTATSLDYRELEQRAVQYAKLWTHWVQTASTIYTSTTSSTYAPTAVTEDSYNYAWNMWLNSRTTSTDVSTLLWTRYNEDYETRTALENEARELGVLARELGPLHGYVRKRPNEEELRKAVEEEKRRRFLAEQRFQAELLAKERSIKLLKACLTPKQREDLEQRRCFYVEVPLPNGKVERYRLDLGTHGNIKQLDEKGSIIRSFCVQPEGVPVGDAVLAQKLFLETSEETRAELFATANITELMPAKRIPPHVPRPERRAYAREHGLLH